MALIDKCIAYYKCDTGSWSTLFDSVGSCDWTSNITWVWTSEWKINWWLDLSNWYFTTFCSTLNNFNPNDMTKGTISVWNKFDSANNEDWWIYTNRRNWWDNRLYIMRNNNNYSIFVWNWEKYNNWGYNYWEWYNIIVDFNNGSWNIYINNTLVQSYSYTTGWSDINNVDARFWASASRDINNSNAWFNDEYAFFNDILTSDERTELYNNWDGLQYWTWTFVEPEPDLTNWLISYYKLDEWAWTTAFDSVSNNDWTLSNTRIWTEDWKINWGWDFTQWDDIVNLWNVLNLSRWTISVWAYNIWNWAILWRWSTTNNNFDNHLRFRDNGIRFRHRNDSTQIWNKWNNYYELTTTETFNVNEWLHIVLTANWNENKIYVNWQQQDLIVDWNNAWNFLLTNVSAVVYFWARATVPTQSGRFFNWKIDEVWIWDRALTSTEVSELYNSWDGLQYPFGTTPTTKKWNIFFWFGGGKWEAPKPWFFINFENETIWTNKSATWWTRYWDSIGNWSIVSWWLTWDRAVRWIGTSGSSYWIQEYTDGGIFEDSDIVFRYRIEWTDWINRKHWWVYVRWSSTSTTFTWYAFIITREWWANNKITFYKYLNKEYSTMDHSIDETEQKNYSWSTGVWYNIRVLTEGNNIKCKIWPEQDAEPSSWLFDIIDNDISSWYVWFSSFQWRYPNWSWDAIWTYNNFLI